MEPQFEAIALEGDSAIKVKHFECSLFQSDHSWHYHPECELTYIIRGEGTRFIGDSVQRFEAGDLVFLAPNIPHCWTNDEDCVELTPRNELVVVQFRPDCFGKTFLQLPDAKSLQPLYQSAGKGLAVGEDVSGQVSKFLLELKAVRGLGRLAVLLQILSTLTHSKQLAPLASEFYRFNESEFNGGRMKLIMAYVEENLLQEIKQTEVADLVGMTPQGFSRFFKATTGRTFVSFINVMRIMEACRLLVNTDQDIIDIAFQCGYSNLSNFNRRFADIKRTTPREYRRQHGKYSL